MASPSSHVPGNTRISSTRIALDLAALSRITEPDRPWTRRAFTPMFLQGRAWLAQRFREAGLEPGIDPSGNLIGRRPGSRPGSGTIMIGSHSDTVPDGGRFDGIAGVLAGLEVARALTDCGITLEHDLEVVDFLAEEVSVFGVSCIGSRGLSATRPAEWLQRIHDGRRLAEAIAEVGGNPDTDTAPRTDIRAFLELHIEQGPVLEARRLDIGLVEAIAGITRVELTLHGRPDHAGTTPMGHRRDALAAAARLVLAVEVEATRLAAMGQGHFAATVGEHAMSPNAANVVPAEVRMLIDIRAGTPDLRDAFLAALEGHCREVADLTGVAVAVPRVISDNPPAPAHPELLSMLEEACHRLDLAHLRMGSGAGHDTAWMGRIAPSAMIFVPCRGGRSHCPEEETDPAEIALGAAVLLDTVLRIDAQPPAP